MITYSKTSWGLHLLLRVYGSAFPRSLPFSLVSTGICAALYVTKKTQVGSDWRHPYPYHAFAFIVGFIVVFRYVCESIAQESVALATPEILLSLLSRSQLSYARYWEGRLQLQSMTARWADFCTEVAACCLQESLPTQMICTTAAFNRAQKLLPSTGSFHGRWNVRLQHSIRPQSLHASTVVCTKRGAPDQLATRSSAAASAG